MKQFFFLFTAVLLAVSPGAFAEQQPKPGGKAIATKDGKKVYPSPKMLAAAKKLLLEIESMKKDTKDFKSKFRLLKLQLRMRPAGDKTSRPPRAKDANLIECTFTSNDKSRSVQAKIAADAAEDVYESSEGLDYKGKDSDGEPIDYSVSFSLGVSENERGKAFLDIMFQEGLVVQDELKGMRCDIPSRRGIFCEEPIDMDGDRVGLFQCEKK